MRAIQQRFVAVAVPVALLAAGAATAQERDRDREAAVTLGGSHTVAAGERVEEVVVIGGSATVAGEVAGDAVAVMGNLTLRDTARVEGDFVVVMGMATIAAGAEVEGDVVVVAGGLDAPSGFRAGGDQVVVAGGLGPTGRFSAVAPWFRDGLLWGRPLAPSLSWTWLVAGLMLLLYLAINIVFAQPVRACAEVLQERPLTAGLGGLLVLLLIGPVALILTVSVVGLVVIPFLICAVLLAGLVGRVAAARWLGSRVREEDDPESWRQGTRSVLIGAVLILLVYLVPVLGLVTWTMLGVFGLGAAAAVVMAGLRRENPAPVPAPAARAAVVQDDGTLVEGADPATAGDPADLGASHYPHADEAAPSGLDEPPADLAACPRAGFWSRAGALALDILLVGIGGALLGAEDGWGFALIVAYHVGFWAWKGTTIGGIVCHVRVVRADGAPIGFTEALVRGLSAIFSVAVAGLGWFWQIWDPERQTWHDKIAGTLVIRAPTSITQP